MTLVQECRFAETPASCEVGDDLVQFVAANQVQDHADVRVSAFGVEKIVEGLAFVTSGNGSASVVDGNRPSLWINEIRPNDESFEWLLIFGNLKGLIIDSAKKSIVVIDLFRSRDDDQGFYYFHATNFDSSVLVEYEGGLFLISKGEVVWHVEKLWNDRVQGVEKNSIAVDGLDSDGEECMYEIDLLTGERR